MKSFNLEMALDGQPVKLRNGQKCFITKRTHNNIMGSVDKRLYVWNLSGKYTYGDYNYDQLDIVGMWEDEPQFNLPKPVRQIEDDKPYYYICNELINDGRHDYVYSEVVSFVYHSDKNYHIVHNIEELLYNGQVFETGQDAQKWLDFMKNYGKEE